MRGMLELIKLCKREIPARHHTELENNTLRQKPSCNLAPLAFLELETAKEILKEVFNTTPSDVEEMIRQRIIELECREEAEPI